ncbi:hypothetical protein ABEV74_16680 [Paenibacillus cisolokensis]|jgi:hypothetical protein|uniref:DUF5668 domain-containing protein n=1 Tax=Paenibacillus cisolokensis TaxID=1658519 RepID=A0ABQ4N2E7_9BACL|nr:MULTISPECIES: hypothetical protein [Paenibacillus]ALS27326.1 hypothetical protein IJ21_19250 [Paenibacillus sp. 32O-W]GIQ62336.1 hypothetical protein PACILC2_09040 [Paenibacillus cisolokensis]
MVKNKYSAGIFILLAGIVILLGKLGVFSFIGSVFWPLFILVPGILLHVLFFGRLLPAVVLIPGGMLCVYALLFLFCTVSGWDNMKYVWPFFILGLAVGLYEFYLFESSRPRFAFTASVALAAVSAAAFALILLWKWGVYLIAIALIAVGAWMMYGRKARSRW